MTEIAGGRWDNLLARLFPIKGRPISPGMSPELMPVVVVQPNVPEMSLLRGERLYGDTVSLAAVAGQTGKFLLRNPTDSNGLIIVERVIVSSGDAGDFQLRTQPLPSPVVDLAVAGNPNCRDTRQAGTAATSAVPGFGLTSNEVSAAAATGALHMIVRLAGSPYDFVTDWGPFVLGPGTGLEVNSPVQASIRVTCLWRERAAEPSELRGV